MNRERAKELLPIIQAFAEGKDIQFRDDISSRKDLHRGSEFSDWQTVPDEPDLKFRDSRQYRIKREPREFWIHKSIQNMYAHNSEIEARQGAFDGAGIATGSTIIHVREVLDDE